MKRTAILVLSHVVLLGIGYVAHRTSTSVATAKEADPATREPIRSSPSRAVPNQPATDSAAYYQKSWKALKTSQLTARQASFLRQKIMREWMEKDLRSALLALSAEGTLSRTGDLMNYLNGGMIRGHEEEILDWINNGDFGLDGSAILEAWASRVGGTDPALLFRLMPRVPTEFHERFVSPLFTASIDPKLMEERIGLIPAIADERLRSMAWKAALTQAPDDGFSNRTNERFFDLLAREDVPAEARQAGLAKFAESLLANNSPATALQDFNKLAPADQAGIARDLVNKTETSSFLNPSSFTTALTMLSVNGQWEIIAERGPGVIDKMFKRGGANAETVSRWALDLPAREETVSTFRRAVGGRFKEDWSKGDEWAATLPDGWHRDQAYAQLAITAEHHLKDPLKRDQAINNVSDPAIRNDLAVWRQERAKAK